MSPAVVSSARRKVVMAPTGILLHMVLTESPPGVSGDAGVSSGLEREINRHYRGADEAEGESAGPSRA